MTSVGNKEVMAKNLKYYIEMSGKDRRELAEAWGFPYSTVTDWVNGKKYPRIDKIEIMADYFGILKSDLVEEKTEEQLQLQKKNDALSDIVIKLQTDDEFFSIVKAMYEMEPEKRSGLLAFLK